jgi:hypothetical protein
LGSDAGLFGYFVLFSSSNRLLRKFRVVRPSYWRELGGAGVQPLSHGNLIARAIAASKL